MRGNATGERQKVRACARARARACVLLACVRMWAHGRARAWKGVVGLRVAVPSKGPSQDCASQDLRAEPEEKSAEEEVPLADLPLNIAATPADPFSPSLLAGGHQECSLCTDHGRLRRN
jgi:hypothetical protein